MRAGKRTGLSREPTATVAPAEASGNPRRGRGQTPPGRPRHPLARRNAASSCVPPQRPSPPPAAPGPAPPPPPQSPPTSQGQGYPHCRHATEAPHRGVHGGIAPGGEQRACGPGRARHSRPGPTLTRRRCCWGRGFRLSGPAAPPGAGTQRSEQRKGEHGAGACPCRRLKRHEWGGRASRRGWRTMEHRCLMPGRRMMRTLEPPRDGMIVCLSST
jgi:hypothetical protein